MRFVAGIAAVAVFGAPAAAFGAPWASTSSTITSVGGTVSLGGFGMDSGSYVLLLVDSEQPACAVRISGPVKAVKGKLTLTGKVPKSLTCRIDGSTSSAPLVAGPYTARMCQPTGITRCDERRTELSHAITVRAQGRSHPTATH